MGPGTPARKPIADPCRSPVGGINRRPTAHPAGLGRVPRPPSRAPRPTMNAPSRGQRHLRTRGAAIRHQCRFPRLAEPPPDRCARAATAVHRREQGSIGVRDVGFRAAGLTMAAKLRSADLARSLGGTLNRASRALTGTRRLKGGSRDVDSLATSRVSAPESANPLPNMPEAAGRQGASAGRGRWRWLSPQFPTAGFASDPRIKVVRDQAEGSYGNDPPRRRATTRG